jgi:diguanylate cyclase (GGDEF)-like protein/PAS domain S-box-containing protein
MFLPEDFARIVEQMNDGLYFVDRQRRITYWNKAAERITGYRAEEVVGHSCADNILIHVDEAGNSLCHGLCPLRATIGDGEARQDRVYLHHRDGHRVPVAVRVTPLRNEQGEIVGGIELFTDDSAQAILRSRLVELEQLALVDPLTQLPNRRYLDSEVEAQFSMLHRGGVPFGVLMADIDHFKRFNDDYGHDVGDLALQAVSRTLAGSVRPFDTMGRWGGEEFMGVFPCANADFLARIADRLCMLVRNTRVEAPAGPLQVTISIGGAVAAPSDTPGSLLKKADELLYRSKQTGRDRAITEGAVRGEEAAA